MDRIQYIDALRGFTMLLVVFAHIETFSFGYSHSQTFLGEFFILFRMPLFFFICGYLSYKGSSFSIGLCCNLIKKRIRVQLVPTFIVGIIYTYICLNRDATYFLLHPAKLGYWFTISLFEMFLLYYIIRLLSGDRYHLVVSIFLSLILLLSTKIAPQLFHDSVLYDVCGFERTFKYFHFFIIGMIISNFKQKFLSYLDIPLIMFSILVLFLICLSIYFKLDITHRFILKPLLGYLGLIIVFSYFKKYASFFENSTFVGKSLLYIGKRTLDIYLIHYFILPKNLSVFGLFFIENSNPVLEFFCVILLSCLVVACCILISNIIRMSTIASKILLGS